MINTTRFLKILTTLCVVALIGNSVYANDKKGTLIWSGTNKKQKDNVWVSGAKKKASKKALSLTFSGGKWQGAGFLMDANLSGCTHLRLTFDGLENKADLSNVTLRVKTGKAQKNKKEQPPIQLKNYKLTDNKAKNTQTLSIPIKACNPSGGNRIFVLTVSSTEKASFSVKSIETVGGKGTEKGSISKASSTLLWTTSKAKDVWVSKGTKKKVKNKTLHLSFTGGKWQGAGLGTWTNKLNQMSTLRLVVEGATKESISNINLRIKSGDNDKSIKERRTVQLKNCQLKTLASGKQVIDISLKSCNPTGSQILQQVSISSTLEASISIKEILVIGEEKKS